MHQLHQLTSVPPEIDNINQLRLSYFEPEGSHQNVLSLQGPNCQALRYLPQQTIIVYEFTETFINLETISLLGVEGYS